MTQEKSLEKRVAERPTDQALRLLAVETTSLAVDIDVMGDTIANITTSLAADIDIIGDIIANILKAITDLQEAKETEEQ